MQLGDLFTQLSFGPLSGLSIGAEGAGSIPVPSQRKVASFVNTGLKQLYARFNLNEKELILRISTGVDTYLLTKEFADNDPTVGLKYIQDNITDPFLEDILKILKVLDVDGLELPVNDKGDELSVFTPNDYTLLVPLPEEDTVYTVVYQSKHTDIPLTAPIVLSQEILLPFILVPALEAYVAYLVFSPMNGQEHTAKAIEHFQRYEMLCSEIEIRDLVSTSRIETHAKLDDRGFA